MKKNIKESNNCIVFFSYLNFSKLRKDIWELLMYLNILESNYYIDLYTSGAAIVLLAQKKIYQLPNHTLNKPYRKDCDISQKFKSQVVNRPMFLLL
jgi:hypothetical protein